MTELRSDRAGRLREAAFDAKRQSEAARKQRLDGNVGTVGERHAPAEQRVGFDRVDDLMAPSASVEIRRPNDEASRSQHRERQRSREIHHGTQLLLWSKAKEDVVHRLGKINHQRRDGTARGSDNRAD